MKAILLAAGYATRLYPLTKDRPKALLPVNGKAIADYIVQQICTIPTVDEIFVVSNHKFAAHFEEWAQNSAYPVPLRVLDDGTTSEENRLGAIGDIQFTIEQANINNELLVIAGDNLFTFQLVNFYNFYKNVGKDCVVAKRIEDVAQLRQFAVAQLDQDGKVLNLVEKPENPASDTAVFASYLYTKETVPLFKTYLEEGNKPDAPGYFVQWLYARKDVYAHIMDGDCYDVGTMAAYEEVQRLFT